MNSAQVPLWKLPAVAKSDALVSGGTRACLKLGRIAPPGTLMQWTTALRGRRRTVDVTRGELSRLSDLATRGWDEQVATVDGRTATMREYEFLVLRVVDGVPQGLPESASPTFRRLISQTAALPAGTTQVPVTYAGDSDVTDTQPTSYACSFDPADLLIGGSAQRNCIEALLARADRRVVIHSTFLDAQRFGALSELIRITCLRGVTFDLLWGAEKDEETERNNAAAASEIAKLVRDD